MDEPSHPPLSVSIEIGEFLYNLRSALDNLVCALVRVEKRSHASCSGSSFPIHTARDPFDKEVPRALNGIASPAKALIEELQPFQRGDQASEMDPLNVLNKLRNYDTHRALHLAIAYHRNARFLVSDASTGNPLAYAVLPETLYPANGPQTIHLPITAGEMPSIVNVTAASARGVQFREEGPWADRSVAEVLQTCFDYVMHRVVARFTHFFT